MGLLSEIVRTFDHFLSQLALVGLKVKVSKCKFWSPSRIFPGIEIHQGCILMTYDLRILGVPMGFQDFAMHFLDVALS
jgi:hypothetical protein